MKYDPSKPIEHHLHDGEPYFLFRAQDALSPVALLQYAVTADRAGLDTLAQQVIAVGVLFAEWQRDNPTLVKLPD